MLQHLNFQYLLYYASSGCLWEVKNKKFQAFSSKSGHERGSLTRGSKYSDLTWKHLVVCKTDPRREVVTTRGLTNMIS